MAVIRSDCPTGVVCTVICWGGLFLASSAVSQDHISFTVLPGIQAGSPPRSGTRLGCLC